MDAVVVHHLGAVDVQVRAVVGGEGEERVARGGRVEGAAEARGKGGGEAAVAEFYLLIVGAEVDVRDVGFLPFSVELLAPERLEVAAEAGEILLVELLEQLCGGGSDGSVWHSHI